MLCVAYMPFSFRVYIGFGQSKVHNMQNIFFQTSRSTNQNIFWFDIPAILFDKLDLARKLHQPINQSLIMDFLNAMHQLYSNHQHSFCGKSSSTKVEQFLQVWSKKIKN